MPKKDSYGDGVVSETGNWNVADKYTKSKIMMPLNLADYYEDIALYGHDSLVDELINYSAPPNDVIRYNALKRSIDILIKLVRNVKFSLKVGKTREVALGYMVKLIELKKALPNLVRTSRNEVEKTSSLKIKNYAIFERFIENVAIIKSKLNEPLNMNHLIFTDKEDFDPKQFKRNMKERIVEQG